MKDFASLGLKKNILSVLDKLKLKKAFEVQEKVIPYMLRGKNVVFTSRTGSGKTLAYILGFLGKINPRQGLQMLIIVPTRELCIQVGKEARRLCEPIYVQVGILYGGRDIRGDYKTTDKKNQIIVATPGRLITHINEKKIRVGSVKCIVYDESDQMFDNGFYDECKYILKRIDKYAQVIMSSATKTIDVKRFIKKEITDPVTLSIGRLIPKNIIQEKIYCEKSEKDSLLVSFLKKKKFKRAMVFCNTKIKCANISDSLVSSGYNAKILNSDLTQEQRQNCLNLFRAGKIMVLVTTDIASRGLHIEKVDIVINYDVPRKEEFYIHRIGRTGRFDRKGHSVTMICPEDINRFRNIEFLYEPDVKELRKEEG